METSKQAMSRQASTALENVDERGGEDVESVAMEKEKLGFWK